MMEWALLAFRACQYIYFAVQSLCHILQVVIEVFKLWRDRRIRRKNKRAMRRTIHRV